MLTIDLGNSRLKACRWAERGGSFHPGSTWSGAAGEGEALRSWARLGAPGPVALSSVASPDSTRRLAELLAADGARVLVRPDPGLENRCQEPERVGADRLYAAAGAAAILGRSALVVDAGTALTVDALVVDAGRRVFLGGAIAPGPALAAAGLASGTANLPFVEPRPGARALGTVTEEAILAGVVVGFRGAAAELVRELARETGLEEAPIVLTGGAREFLLVPGPFTSRPIEVVPELVHRGLLAALLAGLARPDVAGRPRVRGDAP